MITAKEARQQINETMEKWVKKQYPKWFNTSLKSIEEAVKNHKSSVVLSAPYFISDDLFHELMNKFRQPPYNFHVSDCRDLLFAPEDKVFKVSW